MCDGQSDCTDGADEADCAARPSSVCSFGTCSHICQEKPRHASNESAAFCLCAPGYEQTEHKRHCKAVGSDPVLLVANENTIRHLNPHSFHTMVRLEGGGGGEGSSSTSSSYGHASNEDGFLHQLKIESLDLFYDGETPVAFLSLRNNGTIVYVRFVTEVEVHRRRRRSGGGSSSDGGSSGGGSSGGGSSIINQTTGVLVPDAGKPRGLAVDWVNRNLYW